MRNFRAWFAVVETGRALTRNKPMTSNAELALTDAAATLGCPLGPPRQP